MLRQAPLHLAVLHPACCRAELSLASELASFVSCDVTACWQAPSLVYRVIRLS